MPTIPIRNNPIARRIDLRVTNTVDIVYRKTTIDLRIKGKTKRENLEEQLEVLKSKLSDQGFFNTSFCIVEGETDDYFLSLVIDPYLYFIKWATPTSRQRRFDRVIDMHKWCEDNCSGEFTLNELGASFSSEEDAFLWQMRF